MAARARARRGRFHAARDRPRAGAAVGGAARRGARRADRRRPRGGPHAPQADARHGRRRHRVRHRRRHVRRHGRGLGGQHPGARPGDAARGRRRGARRARARGRRARPHRLGPLRDLRHGGRRRVRPGVRAGAGGFAGRHLRADRHPRPRGPHLDRGRGRRHPRRVAGSSSRRSRPGRPRWSSPASPSSTRSSPCCSASSCSARATRPHPPTGPSSSSRRSPPPRASVCWPATTPRPPPAPARTGCRALPPSVTPHRTRRNRLNMPSSLRVLIAVETYPPDVNGAARFAERLAGGLAGRGHDVHVVAPSPERAAQQGRARRRHRARRALALATSCGRTSRSACRGRSRPPRPRCWRRSTRTSSTPRRTWCSAATW